MKGPKLKDVSSDGVNEENRTDIAEEHQNRFSQKNSLAARVSGSQLNRLASDRLVFFLLLGLIGGLVLFGVIERQMTKQTLRMELTTWHTFQTTMGDKLLAIDNRLKDVQSQWNTTLNDIEAQFGSLKTEIHSLHSLMDMNVVENLIYLKILVLNPKVPNETAQAIASAVYKHARRYKQEVDLVLAIMKVESNFDPIIVSNMGAIGLMQVMPQWIDILDIQCNLKEPDCNTQFGLQILGAYQHLYADLDMALTAYNRGPGPVDAALMKGKNPDNGYSGKIRSVYDRLRAMNAPISE
jgi:hypothetical protein